MSEGLGALVLRLGAEKNAWALARSWARKAWEAWKAGGKAWTGLGKSLAAWTSLGRKAWMGLEGKERRLGCGLDEAWLLGPVLGEKLGRLGRVLDGRKEGLDEA